MTVAARGLRRASPARIASQATRAPKPMIAVVRLLSGPTMLCRIATPTKKRSTISYVECCPSSFRPTRRKQRWTKT
jgi:hypothetical protein